MYSIYVASIDSKANNNIAVSPALYQQNIPGITIGILGILSREVHV